MAGGWWMLDAWNSPSRGPIFVMSCVVWVIGSIVLHELAHGWMAIRCGDRTPIEEGHMTWNPLVHMDQMSLLMFALVGVAWGAMPVNPSRFRGRYDEAKVAAAGPAMNLALSMSCVVLSAVWLRWGSLVVPANAYLNVLMFLSLGASRNLFLMFFNLVPVPPLDGSKILGNFVPSYERLFQAEKSAIVVMIAFVLLFQFGGLAIFRFSDNLSFTLIDTLAKGLGAPVNP